MLTSNKAFTFIELLTVLIVLGIMMTIAVPLYSKYVLRARVNAMLSALTPAKFAVTNDYFNFGVFTSSNYSYNSGTGNPQFLKPTTYVSCNKVVNGAITIVGNSNKLNSNAIKLTLTPSADPQQQVTWACCVSSSSFYDFVPPECKSQCAAAACP